MDCIRRLTPAFALSALLLTGAGGSEDARLDELVDAQQTIWIDAHPELATRLGLKSGYDRWSPSGDAGDVSDKKLRTEQLVALKTVDPSKLDAEHKRTYEIFQRTAKNTLDELAFTGPRWAMSQQGGAYSEAPALLISAHRIDSASDAEAYIARVRGIALLLDQDAAAMESRTPLPRFMFPTIAEQAGKLIDGAALKQDFAKKLADAKIADAPRLAAALDAAIAQQMTPAYEKFVARVNAFAAKATGDTGMRAVPNGPAYYALRLRIMTTEDKADAHAIHLLGLKEVDRIHGEMRALMPALGFQGTDLKAFFAQQRQNDGHDYENDDASRERALNEARAIVADVKAELPKLFHKLPKADIEVRRVEGFREQGAATAFYQAPPLDGSRPGIFYYNLRDMHDLTRGQLPGFVYHEAIPGHHMQIALTRENPELTRFRKLAGGSAYAEGWALYSEKLMRELGFYKDAPAKFGQLNNELLRAMRLVLDTGVHAEGWSREKALQWFVDVSPYTAGRAQAEVDRYYASPGQAVSYKMGEIAILEMREKAKTALGAKFDLARFHDEVLRHGNVPLAMLRDIVDQWIAAGGV
ncbi:DUF885 domain-containing protein [Roseiterribacter gracilis]|uniref:DUF885 domain-containing protein n=1 Tax=Roseiterribacter gracilis TaxID=2812848 RepID=A0A8S8X7Y3_9PROT|nr:hypothetical protein TMPK1_17200 [Rhodospirillales bacterium TMPK1]